eukprot:403364634
MNSNIQEESKHNTDFCNLHNHPNIYINSNNRQQLYCQICIQEQSDQGIIDYIPIEDELFKQFQLWHSLKQNILGLNKQHQKLMTQIKLLENKGSKVQDQKENQNLQEEEKSSFDDDNQSKTEVKIKQQPDQQNQEFLGKMQLLLGQNDQALPDLSRKLLTQAIKQLSQDDQSIQLLQAQINNIFTQIEQFYQNREITQIIQISRQYFRLVQAHKILEQNQQQILTFVNGITINQSHEYNNAKELRKLEGLAKLSIEQSSLWQAEQELIKLYCNGDNEQSKLLIQIFQQQNQLVEMLEKEAKEFHRKLKTQEDSLNYVKFQLSRSENNQTNQLYVVDTHITQKFAKYVSDKVAKVNESELASQKHRRSKQRQELINQLIGGTSVNSSQINLGYQNVNASQEVEGQLGRGDHSLAAIVNQLEN